MVAATVGRFIPTHLHHLSHEGVYLLGQFAQAFILELVVGRAIEKSLGSWYKPARCREDLVSDSLDRKSVV